MDHASRNIRTIMQIERDVRRERGPVDLLTDRIAAAAGSPAFILFHVIWFAAWVGVNVFGHSRFDPYPFNLLTLAVSLEAIVLTGFVLIAQNRMTQLADKRAHLDLQVNLLAEEELTAILKVVCLIATKNGIDVDRCDPRLNDLLGKTDVKGLADALSKELEGAAGMAADRGRARIIGTPAS